MISTGTCGNCAWYGYVLACFARAFEPGGMPIEVGAVWVVFATSLGFCV